MIKKYNNFISELILENIINESIIYYTPPVTKILTSLSNDGNEIAKELINVACTDIKPDITFVDFDNDKEGYFEFSTMKNVQKIIGSKYAAYLPGGEHDLLTVVSKNAINVLYDAEVVNPNNTSNTVSANPTGVFKTARNPIKIGRMVNSIFPGKFTAKEVENFVNLIKSRLEKSSEKFIIVEGDDIPKWYKSSTYKELAGDLGRSCMRSKSSSIFKIYSHNPEVCRMLILLEDEQLIGRALVWKVKSVEGYGAPLKDMYFMDRQYTIIQSDVEKFKKYAEDNDWMYKTYNNHHSLETVTYKNQEFNADMEVQLDTYKRSYDYEEYPYLDTFRRYDPTTGILYNDSNQEDENTGNYILDGTDGYDFTRVTDDVWSEYYDTEISRDDAVWSDVLSDWIYADSSIRVTVGNYRGYYPDGYEDIIYDSYIEEYIHVESSVYSEYDDENMLSDNALVTAMEIDSEGMVETEDNMYKESRDIVLIKDIKKENREWYNKISDQEFDTSWKNIQAILYSLLTNDYKNEYILKQYEIETFLLKTDNEKNRFYLTKEDAKLLNFEIIEDESRDTDWFDYYKEIKTYNDLTLFRDKPLVTIEEIYELLDADNSGDVERILFLERFYKDDLNLEE